MTLRPLAALTIFLIVSAAAAQTAPAATAAMPNPNDPRAHLTPGLRNAGEAASGMVRLDSLGKPDVFTPPPPAPGSDPRAAVRAQLGFANSDLAFAGTHLFLGNFYGVNMYDISKPGKLSLISTLVCPGGQGDVSVYGNLLFMSVEAANGRLDCGTQGFPTPPPPPPTRRRHTCTGPLRPTPPRS